MLELFIILFLIAAAQGFLLSLVLFTKKENHSANLILACAILALSFELLQSVYYVRGWYKEYPHLMGISYPFPFLYGPFFYLYAALISKQKDCLRWADFLHLLPLCFIYVAGFPYYFLNSEEKILFVERMVHHNPPQLFAIFGSIIPFQGILYTILTIQIVTRYNRTIKDSFSNIDRINLSWLKLLNIAMIIIWSFVAISFLIHHLTPVSREFDVILYILISLLIYSIGYKGLKQPEIFMKPISELEESTPSAKYERSGLSKEDTETLKQTLLAFMQNEKPHLDNELTLQKLADRLLLTTHNLSEVINSGLNQSYYDFINSYRLEEFKTRVADPANDKYNLLSIAFDSGFKSKGTFNAIFKKSAGITPSEYKATLNSSSK
jgi:AraC-like DNA-binding protein